MKQLFILILAFAAPIISQAQQKNPFNAPFTDAQNIESSRSEFLTYRKTSGTKGSPIDTTLSFSPLQLKWDTLNNTNTSIDVSSKFIIPFEYMDKSMYLKLGATSGKTTLFVNDSLVGFRLDSRLPVEFNITKYAQRGMNELRLVTENVHVANQIEAPTQLNVEPKLYLFVQPKIRVKDILTKINFEPTFTNSLLEIALLIKTELINEHTVTVYYDLFDPQGNLVNQEFKDISLGMYKQDTVRFTASIDSVQKWSANNPNLYTVKFRVQREGRFTEFFEAPVGFRKVEIIGDMLLINGQAEVLRGINADVLAELIDVHTPYSVLEQRLRELKDIGFNAIRTPFPLKSEFYALCNEVGIYVVETANLNTGTKSKKLFKGGTLANVPAWEDIFTGRVVNTILRGKAQPSIIAWSMGGNAGNGYNMYAAHLAAKKTDDSRPIVYDGAGKEWNSELFMPIYPIDKTLQSGSNLVPFVPARLEFEGDFFASPVVQGAFYSQAGVATIDELKAKFAKTLPEVLIELVDRKKGIIEITNNTGAAMTNVVVTSKVYRKDALKYEFSKEINLPSQSKVAVTLRKIADNQELTVCVNGVYEKLFNNIK